MMELAYLGLLGATGYGTYRLMALGRLDSFWSRALAILAISSATTLSSVGPLGLILGGPSIVLSSILVALLLKPKENV
jgi:hypothetical protein